MIFSRVWPLNFCFTSSYYVVAIKISNQEKWFRELFYQVFFLALFHLWSSWGGIYSEQMVTALCKVAETAIAYKFVLMFISFWGIFFLIRIDTPLEALCPIVFCFFLILFSLIQWFPWFLGFFEYLGFLFWGAFLALFPLIQICFQFLLMRFLIYIY